MFIRALLGQRECVQATFKAQEGGSRMRIHRNAKTTPMARALITQRVDEDGWTIAETAEEFNVQPASTTTNSYICETARSI